MLSVLQLEETLKHVPTSSWMYHQLREELACRRVINDWCKEMREIHKPFMDACMTSPFKIWTLESGFGVCYICEGFGKQITCFVEEFEKVESVIKDVC